VSLSHKVLSRLQLGYCNFLIGKVLCMKDLKAVILSLLL